MIVYGVLIFKISRIYGFWMASLLSEIDVIGNLHKTFFGNQKSEQLVKMGSFFIQLAIGEKK